MEHNFIQDLLCEQKVDKVHKDFSRKREKEKKMGPISKLIWGVLILVALSEGLLATFYTQIDN